jgi:hypothetical protein
MKINGIEFIRTKSRPNGRWYWRTNPTVAEILVGTEPRRATAAEARKLNAMVMQNPPAMSLSGVHPSYRVV